MATITLSNGKQIQLLKPVIDKTSLPGYSPVNLGPYWDISNVSYSNVSYGISANTDSESLVFSADGTRFFMTGGNTDHVKEYNLGTAWDITTTSTGTVLNVSDFDSNPSGVDFSSDGTKMILCGNATDTIYEFNLSTPWDIDTASSTGNTLILENDALNVEASFNVDGTELLVTGNENNTIYQYSLSTPWSISTASLSGSLDISAYDTIPLDAQYNGDGTKLFVLGISSDPDTIYQFDLSTRWNIETASYDISHVFDVGLKAAEFKPDGSSLFVVEKDTPEIREYNL